MPECRDCGEDIRTGSRCQQHALEHQHGTLEERKDEWTVEQQGIDGDAEGQTTVDGGIAKEESR